MKSYIERNVYDRVMHLSRHNVFSFDKISRLASLDILSESDLALKTRQAAEQMAKYAISHSEFYKNIYKQQNVNGSAKDVYTSLPVIDKNVIRGQEKNISTKPLSLLRKGLTSGTTGTPLAVYRSANSILNEYAYVWYYRMKHGLKKGDPIVSLRSTLNRERLFYYNKVENILYLSPFLLSPVNAGKLTELLTGFKPKAILAYPSYVYNLVHLLSQSNFKIDVPLIFTSSETLHSYQRIKIEQYFSGRIFDWYGNVERTIAIGECDFGNYHEMPLYSLNEYTNKGIVTTSLTNKAYPLIKYFVDDTIVKLDESCKCGKGHVIKAIQGRITDGLVLKDGTQISGISIGYAFIDARNILMAQIIQNNHDMIRVNIVPDKDFCQQDANHLINNLQTRLPANVFEIELNKVEEDAIIRSKSGKFKFVVSDFK